MSIRNKEQERINVIDKAVETLLIERQEITESRAQDLVNWLMKKNALTHNYDMLLGAIASVISVIERNDDEANVQKELWRKSGFNVKKKK